MRPVRTADNLPPSHAVVTQSGSLNFLEPSGPLQACNGTALPFYLHKTNHDCLSCRNWGKTPYLLTPRKPQDVKPQ